MEICPKHYANNANTYLQMATTIIGKLNQADILLHFLFPRSWLKAVKEEKEEKEEKEAD